MKMVICPYCGKVAATLLLGRPAANVGVTEVYDALRLCRSVALAAEKLGCSRALIYKVLKAKGAVAADVISGKVTILLQH